MLVFRSKIGYIQNMDEGIEFNESAFRHGISKESIKHALKYPEYEGPLDEERNCLRVAEPYDKIRR